MIAEVQRARGPLARHFADYWRQSRRPLASLAFVAPLLAFYEVGVLVLGPKAIRNGADVWLRRFLEMVGFGQYFLLPLLAIGLLLAWHHVTREPWRLSAGVLYGMTAECVLLAMLLLEIGNLQGALLHGLGRTSASAALFDAAPSGTFGRLVGFMGAGIYEEVLFRLILLPLVAGGLRLLGASASCQSLGAVVATSLIFSAAHYLGPQGESFAWFSFVFRALAGGFFAVLFVYRGFGIAAGTHAVYDIFVGLL